MKWGFELPKERSIFHVKIRYWMLSSSKLFFHFFFHSFSITVHHGQVSASWTGLGITFPCQFQNKMNSDVCISHCWGSNSIVLPWIWTSVCIKSLLVQVSLFWVLDTTVSHIGDDLFVGHFYSVIKTMYHKPVSKRNSYNRESNGEDKNQGMQFQKGIFRKEWSRESSWGRQELSRNINEFIVFQRGRAVAESHSLKINHSAWKQAF